MISSHCLSMIFFGKPVSTFPDHALVWRLKGPHHCRRRPVIAPGGRRSDIMGAFQLGSQAVSETSGENQERNREIAENESARQVTGDIRVSAWAIAIAVVIALAAVAWVLIRNN